MQGEYALVAINAKYIHSNLAVKYLNNYCNKNGFDTVILEFNINDNIDRILSDIFLTKSNVLAFSCYIWNIEMVLKICSSFKKMRPDSVIILGGPEVSYGATELIGTYADFIITGEGEITFCELLKYLKREIKDIRSIHGLIYKEGNEVMINSKREPITDLSIIPFPYEDLCGYENKIIYYETCRGCPFNCQYCLSSIEKGVRFFPLNRVFKEIDFFIENKVKQVKLVDRTFNCDKERSLKIMNYIIDKKGITNFHFEISPILIDEDFLSVAKSAPKGLFQFEIGVQSTNPDTLKSIKRNEPFNKIKDNIKRLQSLGLSHIHLDLIAGLPEENMKSFEKSFNNVYSLQPDMLQLGFLKLLKGSGLRADASKIGIKYHDHSPYEVISTDSLSYENIITLKNMEKLLNIYYNSGRFKKSIYYIEDTYFKNPFKLYLALSKYFSKKNYMNKSLKNVDLYLVLYEFVSEKLGMTLPFNELLKFDYFISFGTPVPYFLNKLDNGSMKTKVNSFIKNEINIEKYMPELKSMDIRQKLKSLSFQSFYIDVIGDLNEKEVILFKVKQKENSADDRIVAFDISDFSHGLSPFSEPDA